MKLLISFMTAVSLGLACTVLGDDNYSALAAQGYRWVTVNGPYACTTEQDAKRIAAHHTDAIELQVVENIECYYLIPGTIRSESAERKSVSRKSHADIRSPGITSTSHSHES